MHRAITNDQTPNFFFLHYDPMELVVVNVLLIPRFAFSLSCVEKRRALSERAVRARYVGCYFVLDLIPQDARIPVITNGEFNSRRKVREAYNRLRPLEKLKVEKRGWTLDVLQAVQSLCKQQFSLSDVYAHETTLSKLHPDNRHVRDKIRQQLQVLRDLGLLTFLGGGRYTIR